MKNLKLGQLMLEILFVLATCAVALVALLAAVGKGIKNTNTSLQISNASYYVKEGIEIARKARDQSATWGDFVLNYSEDDTDGNDMVLAENDDLPQPGDCPTNPTPNVLNFFRCINFRTVSSDDEEVEVTVTVSWTDGSCPGDSFCRQVESKTLLTKWRK